MQQQQHPVGSGGPQAHAHQGAPPQQGWLGQQQQAFETYNTVPIQEDASFLDWPPQTAEFEAIRNAVMRAVPTLPSNAIPGKFAVCSSGEVFSVRAPRPSPEEDWMALPLTQYAERWVGFQALMIGLPHGGAKAQELKPQFDALVKPLQHLEHMLRTYPMPDYVRALLLADYAQQ
jgi:hypothetical protein